MFFTCSTLNINLFAQDLYLLAREACFSFRTQFCTIFLPYIQLLDLFKTPDSVLYIFKDSRSIYIPVSPPFTYTSLSTSEDSFWGQCSALYRVLDLFTTPNPTSNLFFTPSSTEIVIQYSCPSHCSSLFLLQVYILLISQRNTLSSFTRFLTLYSVFGLLDPSRQHTLTISVSQIQFGTVFYTDLISRFFYE